MIYKDMYAQDDAAHCPEDRVGELCLNCSRSWLSHFNWACDHYGLYANSFFDNVAESNRYLTQSMKDSLSNRKPKKVIPDIPIDTTLPLLEAGHLQDRMRKRHKG